MTYEILCDTVTFPSLVMKQQCFWRVDAPGAFSWSEHCQPFAGHLVSRSFSAEVLQSVVISQSLLCVLMSPRAFDSSASAGTAGIKCQALAIPGWCFLDLGTGALSALAAMICDVEVAQVGTLGSALSVTRLLWILQARKRLGCFSLRKGPNM